MALARPIQPIDADDETLGSAVEVAGPACASAGTRHGNR
jgi:hypothetical protein